MHFSQNPKPKNTGLEKNSQARKIKQKQQKQINKNLEKINTINKKYGKIKRRPTKKEKNRRKNLQKRKKLQRENQKLKKEIRENKKQIKEYENYNKRISDLFKSKTLKQARIKFKKLQGEIKSMPEEIQKFIQNLSKDFETTINHIKNPEIPSTNNLIEGFYKTTFPGKIKRIFRTNKGLKIRLKLSQLRWTKRNVLKIKNKTIHQ
jgi:chromosome segregation ATPase